MCACAAQRSSAAWSSLCASALRNTPYPTVFPLCLQYEIDTDSIGNVVCKKAEELEAAVTVLARHRRDEERVLC